MYLKLQTTTNKSSLSHYLSKYFFFGYDYTKKATINITSEIPLYIYTSDLEKTLKIQQSIKKIQNKNYYLIKIEQKNPIYKRIIDESPAIMDPKHWPFVCVSSMTSKIPHYNILASYYEEITKEKLPVLFQEIANIAKTKPSLSEKINTITSLLSEKMTYLSDSRSLQDYIVARSLQKISDTHLGDCKDFSIITCAILKHIGISSNIVLVTRGETALAGPENFPSTPWDFDHVILKVETPDKNLWVDPTNFVSTTQLLPDIADRRAIVLEVNNSHYEQIPAIQAQDQKVLRSAIWDIQNNTVKIKGNLAFLGIAARYMTGMSQKHSNETIKNMLIKMLGNYQMPILHSEASVPSLYSRIINDLVFDYHLNAQFSGLTTNAGQAIPLKFHFVKKLIAKPGSVSHLYLGSPQIIKDNLILNNIKSIGHHNLDCSIESRWANITRKVQYNKNQVWVRHEIEIKKSWVSANEFESKEYQELLNKLETHFNNGAAIIF